MSNYINKTLILALAIVCIILFYRSCEIQKDYERVASALTISDLKNQKFETELNKKGEEISTQKQLILSQEEALENNLLEIEELKKYKKIQSKTTVKTVTQIDTVFVAFSENPTDSIKMPIPDGFFRYFDYQEKDNWYSFSGTVSDLGLTMYDMSITNKYSLLIADKKLGFFTKPEPQIVLTNENPYTSTISMNNVQIDYQLPFYKKEWFWFALGSATTIFITK
jgi:hypothetical protein|tara:strand:- start:463 stop:1134 length:672 start_codon:yes stop_codon:yes gene_type:complete